MIKALTVLRVLRDLWVILLRFWVNCGRRLQHGETDQCFYRQCMWVESFLCFVSDGWHELIKVCPYFDLKLLSLHYTASHPRPSIRASLYDLSTNLHDDPLLFLCLVFASVVRPPIRRLHSASP